MSNITYQQWQTSLLKSIDEFVGKLTSLSSGDEAILRRNAGNTIAQSPKALGIFYRILPAQVPSSRVEMFFLVATLYPLNKYYAPRGNMGNTMQAINARTKGKGTDRRMALLLDSEFEITDGMPGDGEMAFRLRQCIMLAKAHEIGVDWIELLKDLCAWNQSNRRVRKSWAEVYFTAKQDLED